MADNPYTNKVELADGTVLMDISGDTVTPGTLVSGTTAHDRSGAPITGTFDPTEIIDDTAGTGDTDKAWSADKLTAEFVKKVGGNGRVFYGTDSDVSFGSSVDSCNFMVSDFDEPVTGDIFVISGMKDRYNSDIHPLYAFFNATQSGVTYQYYEIRTVSGSQIPVNERNFSQNSANIFVYNGTYLLLVGASHASTTTYGLTKLVNSSTSSSTTTALVPAALKSVVDSRIAPLEESVAGLIDDTAGTGDTDKTWSADKITEELSSFDPDIIDDTAGTGDTDKAWSADKLVAEFAGKASVNDLTLYCTCQTAASEQVKVASVASTSAPGPITLRRGMMIGVMYRYTNTYVPTSQAPVQLNLAGTGAVSIRTGSLLPGGGANPDVYGREMEVTYYMYDGSFWTWMGCDSIPDTITDIKDGKADKVANATNGNLAALDANGNLVDSGYAPSDFDPSGIIDDTAGEGDTDKAWSADKLTGEFEDVRDGAVAVKTIDTPAEVMTFDDGSRFPMSLGVSVTAKQDLHGYDKPWPGGGGKNLLNLDVEKIKTYNSGGSWSGNKWTDGDQSLEFLSDTDGNVNAIKIAGSRTASKSFILFIANTDNVNYSVNLSGHRGQAAYCTETGGYSALIGNLTSEENSITPSTASYSYFRITLTLEANETYNETIYPMMQVNSASLAPFEPYSNICPISGFDSAVIGVTGQNLVARTISGVNVQGTGTIAISGSYEISIARVVQGEKYTITNTDNAYVYGFFMNFPELGSVTYDASRYVESPKAAQTHTFTAPITGFIAIRNGNGNGTTMIVHGETAKPLSDIGKYYTISFPVSAGTVYGGTLTVNADGTGTLVVNYNGYVFDGSSDESWSTGGQTYKYALITLPEYKTSASLISDRFAIAEVNTTNDAIGVRLVNNNQLRVRYGLFTSLNEAAVRQYFSENPLTIVYDLATPVTYTLTPGQVLSVLGKNNVWADCGQILSLDYETNASRIYDAANGLANTARQETSDLAEGMAIFVDGDTAPKAITSGQYLFIKNHSTLATGGYHATANIASGASVTSSNVSADTDGLVNALNSNIASLVRVGTYSESPFSISNVKEGSLLIAVRSTYFAMYSIGQSSAVPITVSSTSPVSDISVSNETVTITRNGGTSMRVTVIGVSR